MKFDIPLAIFTILTYFPIIFYYNKLLTPKKSKVMSFVIFYILRLFFNIITFYVETLSPYKFFLNLVVDIVLVMVLYKDKIVKKLSSVAGLFAILSMTDFATFISTQALLSFDDKTKYYFSNAFFLLIECIVLLFTVKYIKYLSALDDKKTFASFILIPISQLSMICLLSYQSMNIYVSHNQDGTLTYTGNNPFALTIVAVSVISIVADFVFMRIAYKSAISRQERNQLEILEKENQINYAYYSELQTNADEMRKYRHDVNNIIQTIYVLMNNPNEQGSEDIQKTLKSLEKEINSIKLKKYCSNNLINSILAVNEKRFTSKGIACDIKAAIPENVGIPELDMCRLFTNILDNAYNAMCDESEHSQTLTLEAHISDGFLYISESNTCPDEQKPVKPGHGLGLKIIKEIAEKHGGYFKTEEADGKFSVQTAVMEAFESQIKESTSANV